MTAVSKARFFGKTTLTFIVAAGFIYGLAIVKESPAARDLAVYASYVTAFFAFWWLIISIWEDSDPGL